MANLAKVMGLDVPAGAATKEFFVPCTNGTNGLDPVLSTHPGAKLIALNDRGLVEFEIPDDFNSIIEAVIAVLPTSTQAAANWDITSNYGTVGEFHNAQSEADAATTYNVVNSRFFEVNISGILSAIASGDYVGVRLEQGDNAHTVVVLGVRFKYS